MGDLKNRERLETSIELVEPDQWYVVEQSVWCDEGTGSLGVVFVPSLELAFGDLLRAQLPTEKIARTEDDVGTGQCDDGAGQESQSPLALAVRGRSMRLSSHGLHGMFLRWWDANVRKAP